MKMWTLRSGNIPMESSSGEISMLKDCLEEELTMGVGMFYIDELPFVVQYGDLNL